SGLLDTGRLHIVHSSIPRGGTSDTEKIHFNYMFCNAIVEEIGEAMFLGAGSSEHAPNTIRNSPGAETARNWPVSLRGGFAERIFREASEPNPGFRLVG